jgi:hypothetical protein
MKFISHFLAVLLTLALVVSAGAWVVNQTTGDEHYLVHQAEQAHVADQLAQGLPAMLAGLTPTPDDAKVVLAQAITPAFIQDQIETVLPQLVRYYGQDGAVPQLDLRELEARIQGAGFAVPPALTATLDTPQPVTVGRLDNGLKTAAHTSQQLVWWGPLAALALTVLIVLVARGRRWLVLAGSALGGAVGVAVLAGLA